MNFVFGLFSCFVFSASAVASQTALEVAKYGFVDIRKVDDSIYVDMMYASDFNFLGEKVNGYKANLCYLTKPSAHHLSQASTKLRFLGRKQGRELHLLVRDCYRPRKASLHLQAWRAKPDERMKDIFFPELSTVEVANDSALSARSGHSAGSTIDVTIIEVRKSEVVPLDMGTIVDFFSPKARTYSREISRDARDNRGLLLEVMEPDFVNSRREWWHFTLRDQPYAGKQFNFDVEPMNMRVPASLLPAAVENP